MNFVKNSPEVLWGSEPGQRNQEGPHQEGAVAVGREDDGLYLPQQGLQQVPRQGEEHSGHPHQRDVLRDHHQDPEEYQARIVSPAAALFNFKVCSKNKFNHEHTFYTYKSYKRLQSWRSRGVYAKSNTYDLNLNDIELQIVTKYLIF